MTPLEADMDPGAGARPSDTLSLTTTKVAIGHTALSIGSLPVASADGTLAIAGGAFIERIAARTEGVEQSWDFAAAPTTATGDLVIDIATSGAPFTVQTSTGLHFGAPGHLGVAYSTGRWIDANGVTTEIVPQYANGVIELRVPRAVLDASAYPARLDPTISSEKAADSPVPNSPTGASSQFPDVAFSGAQYLAVWQDARYDGADILGVRLTTTGALVDTLPIAIARKPNVQMNPRVVFINNQYLVVWENWLTNDLEAALVTPSTGAVTQLGALAVTPGVLERKPRIAVRGTEALITYQFGDDIGAIKFTAGSNTFGAPVVVAATANLEHDPAVAANPAGNYLVTWADGVTDPTTLATRYTIKAQQVSSTGALVGAAFDVSLGQGQLLVPDAGFIGGNFVVVWQRNYGGGYTYGTRIDAAGTVLDTHTEAVFGMTTPQTFGGKAITADKTASQPALACAATKCLVTWTDIRAFATTKQDVYAQAIDGTLAAVGSSVAVSTAAFNQLQPHAAVAGTGFFVAWNDTRDGTNTRSAYGARISATNTLLDLNGILMVRGANREITPALARSSSSWLAEWEDSRTGGGNIMGVRLSNAFAINDTPAIDISNAPALQTTPSVALDPSTGNYVSVWADRRSGVTADIYLARAPQTGAVLDVNGIAVTSAVADQLRPDVAVSASGKALVVWQDLRNIPTTGYDVYGAIVDANGTVVTTDIPISAGTLHQITPRVAYDPVNDLFLVIWSDNRNNTDYDVYGARVTTSGTVLDPSGIAIAQGHPRNELTADLAFGSDRFLVVWATANHIFGARVHTDTTALTRDDAADIQIGPVSWKQVQPRVSYIGDSGRNFAVVWSEFTTSGGFDVSGVLISQATGLNNGSNFPIANSSEDEVLPALSRPARVATGNMELALGYQTFSQADATYRVRLRDLAFPTTASLVSIDVQGVNPTIAVGTTQAFTAVGTYSDNSTQNLTTSVTWSSSNTAVATINASGVATGVAPGSTTIRATLGSVQGTSSLTVTNATVTAVTVTPVDPSTPRGTLVQFAALADFSDNTQQDVTSLATWTSSNTANATINANGLASAVKVGTSTITATFGGKNDTSVLTVTNATLTSLAVTPVNATVPQATQRQYTAMGTFSDNSVVDMTSQVTWSTGKASIATIAAGGLLNAVAPGTTTVTAKFGGVSSTTNVTITSATVVSISVTPSTAQAAKGLSVQFKATALFSDNSTQDVTGLATWSSSNGTVASVSNAGGSKGKATVKTTSGSTTISATYQGRVGTATLTATNATLISIDVTPANPTLAVGQSQQMTATGHYSDNTTLDLTNQVAWHSSKNSTVSVNGSGRAQGKKAGSAIVSATRSGITGSTTISVN